PGCYHRRRVSHSRWNGCEGVMRLIEQAIEWWKRASTSPQPKPKDSEAALRLIEIGIGWTDVDSMLNHFGPRMSERKLRLFACACCRHMGALTDDLHTLNAVKLAERWADGIPGLTELIAVSKATEPDPSKMMGYWAAESIACVNGSSGGHVINTQQ